MPKHKRYPSTDSTRSSESVSSHESITSSSSSSSYIGDSDSDETYHTDSDGYYEHHREPSSHKGGRGRRHRYGAKTDTLENGTSENIEEGKVNSFGYDTCQLETKLPESLLNMLRPSSSQRKKIMMKHRETMLDVLFRERFDLGDIVNNGYLNIRCGHIHDIFDLPIDSHVMITGVKLKQTLINTHGTRLPFGLQLIATPSGEDKQPIQIGKTPISHYVENVGSNSIKKFSAQVFGDIYHKDEVVFLHYPKILDDESFRSMASLVGGTSPQEKITELLSEPGVSKVSQENVYWVTTSTTLGHIILDKGGHRYANMRYFTEEGKMRSSFFNKDTGREESLWMNTTDGNLAIKVPSHNMVLLISHLYNVLENLKNKHVKLNSIMLRVYPLSGEGGFGDIAQTLEQLSTDKVQKNMKNKVEFNILVKLGVATLNEEKEEENE